MLLPVFPSYAASNKYPIIFQLCFVVIIHMCTIYEEESASFVCF